MAWTVTASVTAVGGKAQNGSPAVVQEPLDAAGGRVRLIVEMAAAFVGTVHIDTDLTVQDVRVEVHLSKGGEDAADGEGAN